MGIKVYAQGILSTYAQHTAKKKDVLLAGTLPRAPRKWHHVLFQFTSFLVTNQPTLGTKRFGVGKDIRVLMIHVGSGGD